MNVPRRLYHEAAAFSSTIEGGRDIRIESKPARFASILASKKRAMEREGRSFSGLEETCRALMDSAAESVTVEYKLSAEDSGRYAVMIRDGNVEIGGVCVSAANNSWQ